MSKVNIAVMMSKLCWCFILYLFPSVDAACEALTDMPPRAEEELDAVTLHNQALMNMEQHPTQGFEKLQFLLQQNPFPPETFGNLLLLYVKYEVDIITSTWCYCLFYIQTKHHVNILYLSLLFQYFDLAADVLAENSHLTFKFLTPVSKLCFIHF